MNDRHANRSAFGAVLSIRPFRMLWAAQLCSQLGFAMLLFILALRVYQLTGSNVAVSGLFLTFGVPAVFLFPGALPVMYLVSFIMAIITQFYVPAEAPTIPRLVPPELLVTANSLFSFTYFSSLGVGSIVAGPILRLFGPHAVFLLVSAC